jgi:hypothetical protein
MNPFYCVQLSAPVSALYGVVSIRALLLATVRSILFYKCSRFTIGQFSELYCGQAYAHYSVVRVCALVLGKVPRSKVGQVYAIY